MNKHRSKLQMECFLRMLIPEASDLFDNFCRVTKAERSRQECLMYNFPTCFYAMKYIEMYQ